MTVLDEALNSMKARLAEIESEIAPLVAEANQLRDAIARLEDVPLPDRAFGENTTPSQRKPATRRRKPQRTAAAGDDQPSRAPGKDAGPAADAAADQNRARVLSAIATEAKTAGQVAKETGIARGAVATTLTRLVADGAASKVARGYRAT